MAYSYEFTSLAESDIDDAINYIANEKHNLTVSKYMVPGSGVQNVLKMCPIAGD